MPYANHLSIKLLRDRQTDETQKQTERERQADREKSKTSKKVQKLK
jgi:hypothetical protein